MSLIEKFPKLKKSLAVVRDLNNLKFKFYAHGSPKKLYTLKHPNDLYSIWVANGFWFISLYSVNGEYIDREGVSKFGALGKILVYLSCLKHCNRFYKEQKQKEKKADKDFFDLINTTKKN